MPSLLEARRINEFRSNTDIELFETAKVYLPVKGQPIPDQPAKVSFVSSKSYAHVKGVVEAIVDAMSSSAQLSIANTDHELLDPDQSGQLSLDGKTLGFIGKASKSAKKLFRLRSDATFAELDLGVLNDAMVSIVLHTNQSSFPPISRDFNFVLENDVKWDAVEATVRKNGGDLLEGVEYRETFRDEKKDGKTKKRLLLTVTLRSADSTLTGEQADAVCKAIIDGCQKDHGAKLLG